MSEEMVCYHVVGLTDSRQKWLAEQVFGRFDFIHRHWDARARHSGEHGPNDVMVFAVGRDSDPIKPFTFDDSAVMDTFDP